MNDQSFSLTPFPSARPPPPVTIGGTIARHAHTLAVRYRLLGRLEDLAISEPAPVPERKDGLWKDTCFEVFLAVRGAPEYWEFNLSPAGRWNVYRFASYRGGMTEEPAFTALPFSVESEEDVLCLALELDLGRILRGGLALEVAISAILKHKDGSLTHWALIHRGPQPDFHRRDGFIIAL
jgi:hypothetical protein